MSVIKSKNLFSKSCSGGPNNVDLTYYQILSAILDKAGGYVLQAVQRCRRWASAPFAARLVFLFFSLITNCRFIWLLGNYLKKKCFFTCLNTYILKSLYIRNFLNILDFAFCKNVFLNFLRLNWLNLDKFSILFFYWIAMNKLKFTHWFKVNPMFGSEEIAICR